jgi:hypothetical protein
MPRGAFLHEDVMDNCIPSGDACGDTEALTNPAQSNRRCFSDIDLQLDGILIGTLLPPKLIETPCPWEESGLPWGGTPRYLLVPFVQSGLVAHCRLPPLPSTRG